VLEVTERAIANAPAELLAGVVSARERGWLIALDDVGVDPASLAFLPIIQPDVVKLDMGLIQDRPDRELGRTMTAVMAHAERTGAVLLAEGIESHQHLDRAVSLGATLGQGYHFGRPVVAAEFGKVLQTQAASRRTNGTGGSRRPRPAAALRTVPSR
jgi:EAL domain-containing protein (putative c-di-GMP-specific phosphodiesterase class I)